MTDVAHLTKKAFTWSVVTATILWSMGAAALIPLVAQAAECPSLAAGAVVKVASSSSVFLINSDLKRMYFPNAEVYKTWFKDYSNVQTITPACLENYPTFLGNGVNYRPGSRLVKSTVTPSVYAVGANNTRHKIASEAVAAALYGAKWATVVRDVADVFMGNLADGAELASAKPHDGMLVKKASSADVYLVTAGKYVKVDGALSTQASGDVRTVSDAVFAAVEVGTGSVAAGTVVDNPSQKTGGSTTVTPPVTTGGNVTVSLSANTPAVGQIPDGSAFVDVLKFNVAAGDKDVKVKGVTVTRTGFTSNSNVTGVSLWDQDSNRHGEVMTSFNSDNQVVIGFASYPIVVAKGTSQTITIKMNLGSSASGGSVGAKISKAADVDTDGTVAGSFPVNGNVMSVVDGSASLSAVNIDSISVGGLSSEPSASTAGNVEIGQTKEIAKIKLTESSGINDVVLEQITFYFAGSAKDSDLKDLVLVGPLNEELGKVASISDRYATVKLTTPYTVPKSTNRTLTLKARIADGSGNWFRTEVQSEADTVIKDKAQNFGILVTDSDGGTYATERASDGWFKMKSGSLSVSKASDSPAGSVSAGATDVVLAKFEVKGVGENLEVRKMGIQIASSSASGADLSGNVKVYANDVLVLTFSGDYDNETYSSSGEQKTLSQYFTVKSGEATIVKVVATIDSAASSQGYTISLGNFYARRLSTLDFADNLPSSSVNSAANTLTVQTSSVSVVKDTSVGNKNIAAGAEHLIGQFIVKNNDAEEINVSNITVNMTAGTASAPDHLQNLTLWDGASQLGTTITSVATSSNSFSTAFKLAKNEAKVVQIKAKVLSTATASATIITSSTVSFTGVTTGSASSASGTAFQTMTVSSAQVVLTAASDITTLSKILTPSATAVQVGKWKWEAQNEAVTLKKITFVPRDALLKLQGTLGNWGTFSLYDADNMTTPIGTATLTPGASATVTSTVQFTGLDWTAGADTTKYLVLKATINGSGSMTAATSSAFAVLGEAADDMQVYSSSGSLLGATQIDASNGESATGTAPFAAASTYLYHNSAPVITAGSLGTALTLGTATPVFKFTVKNVGDRELRVSSTTVSVSATGLANTTSATGTLSNWRLYEANEAGGIGTLLASTNTCYLGPATGNSGISEVGCMTATTITIPFNPSNDTNSLLDSFTIAPGASRTLILAADTTDAADGKTSGTITVSGKLDGTSSYLSTDTGAVTHSGGEQYWGNGVLYYFYTPVGGSENSNEYNASDSYDVEGSSLSLTL